MFTIVRTRYNCRLGHFTRRIGTLVVPVIDGPAHLTHISDISPEIYLAISDDSFRIRLVTYNPTEQITVAYSVADLFDKKDALIELIGTMARCKQAIHVCDMAIRDAADKCRAATMAH